GQELPEGEAGRGEAAAAPMPPPAYAGEEVPEGEACRQESAAAPWIERLLVGAGLWRRQEGAGAPSQPPPSPDQEPPDSQAGIRAAAVPLPPAPSIGRDLPETEVPTGDGAVGAAPFSARLPTGPEPPEGEAGSQEAAAAPLPPPSLTCQEAPES